MSIRKNHLFLVCALCAAVVFGFCGPIASGDEIFWDNLGGGSFNDSSKWSPAQVPGENDVAVFNLSASGSPGYTVDFGDNVTNERVMVRNDSLKFILNDATYRLLGSSGESLVVGVDSGEVGELAIARGTVACGGTGVVGRAEGSFGMVAVEDPGTAWSMYDTDDSVSPWRDLYVGDRGNGELAVRGGAYVEAGQGWAGAWETSTGIVRAENGGRFYIDGFFRIGAYGTGELHVDSSSRAEMGYCTMGEFANSYGMAEVRGENATWEMWNPAVAENLVVGGGGTGEVFVSEGGRITTTRDIIVGAEGYSSGRVYVGDTYDGAVPGGGQVECASLFLGRDANSQGFMNVDSTETSPSVVTVGRNFTSGNVFVGKEGGGQLNIGPYSQVLLPAVQYDFAHPEWVSSVWMIIGEGANSIGTVSITGPEALLNIERAPLTVGKFGRDVSLNILDGGKLFMGDGEFWAGMGAGSQASINVEGGGVIDESSAYPSVIGGAGQARMRIIDSWDDPQGTVAHFSHLVLGESATGNGLVEVATGRLEVAGNLVVGGAGVGYLNLHADSGAPGVAIVGDVDPATVPAGELHVGPNGQLDGTGRIKGNVVCKGSFVRPGYNGIGTLSIEGNYTQIPDGNLVIVINPLSSEGFQNNLLNVEGDVTLNGGGLILSFGSYLPQEGDVFDLITFSGQMTTPESDWFDAIWCWGLDDYNNGADWHHHFELVDGFAGGHILRLVSDSAVPEPATLVLLALGGLAGIYRHRRN